MLHLPSETSQGGDGRELHEKKSKGQGEFGNKDCSGKTGVAKTKIKRPASPYHVSSVTVYQRDGGKGFTSCKDTEEKMLEQTAADGEHDVRAKWFLSTNQWQGFIPLQIPGLLGNEEVSVVDNQPTCYEDIADSIEMSSTVSESLEKMKENHSLFYKIACDISISDSDIAKNDGNTNAQTLSRPEMEELLITEYVPDGISSAVGKSPNQESKTSNLMLPADVDAIRFSTCNKLQQSKLDSQEKGTKNTLSSPAKPMNVCEEICQKESEGTSWKGSQVNVIETNHGDADDSRTTEREVKKVDQVRFAVKKFGSLGEENEKTVEEGEDSGSILPSSSVHEDGGVIRSASFGKTRVTVLRTSL